MTQDSLEPAGIPHSSVTGIESLLRASALPALSPLLLTVSLQGHAVIVFYRKEI